MKRIELTWDYVLILEWVDESGALCDGPDFETILPPRIFERIDDWVGAMDAAYGGLGEGELVNVPDTVAAELHKKLIDIQAELRTLGHGVAETDEWWIDAASRKELGWHHPNGC